MGNECSTAPNFCKPSGKSSDQDISKLIPFKRRDSHTIQGFHDLISHISQRSWTAKEDSFLCTEKFFLSYKEYLRDQTFIAEVWNNVHSPHGSPRKSESQKLAGDLKLLVRTGVPLDYFHDLILAIFKKSCSRNSLEYECAVKVAFPGSVPETFKNVPLFSYSRQLEDILPVHFLNSKGLEAFKRVMWVYEKNIPMLEYSPLLSQTVALLLLFINEDETYCVVKKMLETSEQLLDTKDGLKSLKWHLTLTREQFDVFLESLSSFLKDRPNDLLPLWKHFKKINYDCNDLFWQLTKTLFLGYLPLATSLKIFMAYLNEGIRIYGRFTLALLKLFQNDILLCTNSQSILSVIKDKCANITKFELQTLMTSAYGLRLCQLKQRIPTIQPQSFHAPESARLYYPHLLNRSCIVSNPHFETIWEWLPNIHKIANPSLAYCSLVHGWSLNTLYSKCSQKTNYKAALLLIKTTNSTVLGAFIDGMVTPYESKASGTNDSFVFQLAPEEKRFKSSNNNNEHLMCNRDSLSIGGGAEGPAIYLRSDLLSGSSRRSDTYENDPLTQTDGEKHDSHFECYAVEVYWLD